MAKFSGPEWCDLFPTSSSVDDLASPFMDNVKAFIRSMEASGMVVVVQATRRPAQRAYLMHWCCQIAGYRDKAQAFHQISPFDVEPMAGVDIDWTCGGDIGKARAAATAMRNRYGIVFPAALNSLHITGRAIDMTIHMAGDHRVRNAKGVDVKVCKISDLYEIGASFGVHKLLSDPPHWSDNGH